MACVHGCSGRQVVLPSSPYFTTCLCPELVSWTFRKLEIQYTRASIEVHGGKDYHHPPPPPPAPPPPTTTPLSTHACIYYLYPGLLENWKSRIHEKYRSDAWARGPQRAPLPPLHPSPTSPTCLCLVIRILDFSNTGNPRNIRVMHGMRAWV